MEGRKGRAAAGAEGAVRLHLVSDRASGQSPAASRRRGRSRHHLQPCSGKASSGGGLARLASHDLPSAHLSRAAGIPGAYCTSPDSMPGRPMPAEVPPVNEKTPCLTYRPRCWSRRRPARCRMSSSTAAWADRALCPGTISRVAPGVSQGSEDFASYLDPSAGRGRTGPAAAGSPGLRRGLHLPGPRHPAEEHARMARHRRRIHPHRRDTLPRPRPGLKPGPADEHPRCRPDLGARRLTEAIDGTGVRHIPPTAEGVGDPCQGGEHHPSGHPGPARAPILTLALIRATAHVSPQLPAGPGCLGSSPGPECLPACGVRLVPARRCSSPATLLFSATASGVLSASADSGSLPSRRRSVDGLTPWRSAAGSGGPPGSQ